MRSRRADDSADATGTTATRPRIGALALPDLVLVAALFVAPLAFIILRSFGRVDPVTLDIELTGTLDAYRTLWSPTYRPVLARSALLSLTTVALAVAVGLPAALAAARLDPRWRSRVLIAVMLPSFVSFTVRIFAIRGLLETGGPVESLTGWQLLFRPAAVLIGMTTAYVPLFFLPAFPALSRVPHEILDAPADLGASRWRRTWTVTLPLARSGIGVGAALVAILSTGEFISPSILGGGKVLLVGTILADRGAGRGQPLAGAITLTLLAAFALAGLVMRLVRR